MHQTNNHTQIFDGRLHLRHAHNIGYGSFYSNITRQEFPLRGTGQLATKWLTFLVCLDTPLQVARIAQQSTIWGIRKHLDEPVFGRTRLRSWSSPHCLMTTVSREVRSAACRHTFALLLFSRHKIVVTIWVRNCLTYMPVRSINLSQNTSPRKVTYQERSQPFQTRRASPGLQ